MGLRLAAGIGYLVLALALLSGVSPASAQGCYPPPCGEPAAIAGGSSLPADASVISNSRPVDEHSAFPFAAAGLLMVAASLSIICLRRRAAMGVQGRILASPLVTVQVGSPSEHAVV